MLNGVTQLVMTKADVLDAFDKIFIATAYKKGSTVLHDFPYSINKDIEPVYKELPGWQRSLVDIKKVEEFPGELTNYINFLELELEVPITYISVGPDREQIIKLK